MKFVNNWRQQMALAQGAASASLDLPDGEYVLVMSDAAGASATRWEYLRAVVAGGVGTLQRGQEGSEDQEWPEGSVIYCSVTADTIATLFAQLAAQAEQITDLTARVTALEPEQLPMITITVGSPGPWAAGYVNSGGATTDYGSAEPPQLEIPDFGTFPVLWAYMTYTPAVEFTLIFEGEFPVALIESVNVQGAGVLTLDAAEIARNEAGETVFMWPIAATDWFDSVGQPRTLDFTIAPLPPIA